MSRCACMPQLFPALGRPPAGIQRQHAAWSLQTLDLVLVELDLVLGRPELVLQLGDLDFQELDVAGHAKRPVPVVGLPNNLASQDNMIPPGEAPSATASQAWADMQ